MSFAKLAAQPRYDQVPDQRVNARDRFGNYYFVDNAGTVFRFVSGMPAGAEFIKIPNLKMPKTDDYNRGPVARKVEKALQERMLKGEGANYPGGVAQWMSDQRKALTERLNKDTRKSQYRQGVQDIGLHNIDALKKEFGDALRFDSRGQPYKQTETGVEAISPHRNAQATPGKVLEKQRYLNKLQNPKYLSALTRAYAATGKGMPSQVVDHISNTSKRTPGFDRQLEANQVADQYLENKGFPKDVDRGDLVNQAQKLLDYGKGKPVEPPKPVKTASTPASRYIKQRPNTFKPSPLPLTGARSRFPESPQPPRRDLADRVWQRLQLNLKGDFTPKPQSTGYAPLGRSYFAQEGEVQKPTLSRGLFDPTGSRGRRVFHSYNRLFGAG